MPNSPFLAPERDSAFKRGRPKGGGTTYYGIPGLSLSSVAASGFPTNTATYTAWFSETPLVIDQLAVEVTTGAAFNIGFGFYAADADWQPSGAPLADSGNVSGASTGVKTYTPGTPVYVPRGRYLSIINRDGGVAVRFFQGAGAFTPLVTALGVSPFPDSMQVAQTFGAFPTPGTVWTAWTGSGSVPQRHAVVYRVSSP